MFVISKKSESWWALDFSVILQKHAFVNTFDVKIDFYKGTPCSLYLETLMIS